MIHPLCRLGLRLLLLGSLTAATACLDPVVGPTRIPGDGLGDPADIQPGRRPRPGRNPFSTPVLPPEGEAPAASG